MAKKKTPARKAAANPKSNSGATGEEQLRQPAEVKYADQLDALKQNDKDTPPESWNLSPRAVLTYIVGGQTLKATIGGKKVEPGDRVVMFAYGAHHDPRFWQDPEEFRPERWMGDAKKKQTKYAYLPFGGGRRSCIGGAMSQVENTLALSILLRRFRPEYAGEGAPGISGTVTLTPRGGLMFRVHER